MRVVLVRHGEIDSNRAHVYSGRSGEPLNAVGRAQAHIVAEQLREMNVSALFSSPLQRTMETATIIGQYVSLVPQTVEAFNELRMGPWEGLSEAEVAACFPDEFDIWNRQPDNLRLNGRETLEGLQQRALGGLSDVISRVADDGLPVVVSHVAVIRVLMLYAACRPLSDYKKIYVPNAVPIELKLLDNIFNSA